MNTQCETGIPTNNNVVTHLFLDNDDVLPEGLTLNGSIELISGIPPELLAW